MSKPILCLDFDGVIHGYQSGWQGADVIPDPPVPGALEFIRLAQEHFEVEVFSSRTHQDGGLYAMQKWMIAHMKELWGPQMCADVYGLVGWPQDKPAAMVTIDDRALTFTGEWPTIESLRAFKPWNKK